MSATCWKRSPGCRRDGLTGGVSYYDAATDDAGLTRANVVSAVEHGAIAADHAKAESTIVNKGKADGALVRDMLGDASVRVSAKVTVSATGPWQAKGTKGSHIIVPRPRVGNHSAVTMTSPDDGRVMFVLPSGEQTLVGTTDIYTAETPDDVKASDAEIAIYCVLRTRTSPMLRWPRRTSSERGRASGRLRRLPLEQAHRAFRASIGSRATKRVFWSLPAASSPRIAPWPRKL